MTIQKLNLNKVRKHIYIWTIIFISCLSFIDWALFVRVAFRLNNSFKEKGLEPVGLTKICFELGNFFHSFFGSVVYLITFFLINLLMRPMIMEKVERKYVLGLLFVFVIFTILIYRGIYHPSFKS